MSVYIRSVAVIPAAYDGHQAGNIEVKILNGFSQPAGSYFDINDIKAPRSGDVRNAALRFCVDPSGGPKSDTPHSALTIGYVAACHTIESSDIGGKCKRATLGPAVTHLQAPMTTKKAAAKPIVTLAGVIAAVLTFCAVSANAAGQQTGTVLDLRVSSPTLANPTHVQIDGAYQNRPGCAVSGFWAIDSDTPAGKSFLATIMLAKALGKQITLAGSGSCSLRSDMETVVQMQIV